jgi:hypothetical protein
VIENSVIVNLTSSIRTFGSLQHAALKELGKIMTLESLNLSLTSLNENGLKIWSSQAVEKVSMALLCAPTKKNTAASMVSSIE